MQLSDGDLRCEIMYAGVDLGATNVRAVVADGDSTVVGRDRRRTPDGPTGIAVTEAVLATLRAAWDASAMGARIVSLTTHHDRVFDAPMREYVATEAAILEP